MKKILIVDDDVLMLKLIKSYLEDKYEVSIVPGGKMALKFLSKRDVDLILLDYQMPEMNGEETLNAINNMCNKSIQVLFLTGEENADMNQIVSSCKAQGYIIKPVNKEELLNKIENIL